MCGGSHNLTFSATGLPPGLAISSSGAISGTPTTARDLQREGHRDGRGASGSTTYSYQIYGF